MNSFKLRLIVTVLTAIMVIITFFWSVDQVEKEFDKSINISVDEKESECYYDCNNQQELAEMQVHQIETKVEEEVRILAAKQEAEKKAITLANEKKKKEQQAQQKKKQSVQIASVSRGESRKSDWIVFEATHYIALCDTGCTGITANGTDVRNNIYSGDLRIIAVDPKVIPLNSIVEVKTPYDQFYAIAADTGGDINSYRIDILVATKSEAVKLGRTKVQLRIVK